MFCLQQVVAKHELLQCVFLRAMIVQCLKLNVLIFGQADYFIHPANSGALYSTAEKMPDL